MVGFDDQDRKLLLTLRKLLDEIDTDSSMSALEVMWQIRTHTRNQAEIPQAIFRVGDRLASLVFLEDITGWEVQIDGDEHQFCSITGHYDALKFIERCRQEPIGLAGQHGN